MSKNFTIGIDIRVLGGSNRAGGQSGVVQFLLGILPIMIKLGRDVKFKLFFNSFGRQKLDYSWLKAENVGFYEHHLPNRLLFASAKFFNAPKIDQLLGGVDVFFSPHFFLSPLSKKCRSVLTIYDLSFARYPEFFSWRKNFWHRFEMNPKKQADQADKVVTASLSTRNDLVSIFGLNPEKIEVVPYGVDEKFFRKPSRDKLNLVKKRYNLPEEFFLFLGTIEPRKNITGVLKAFSHIKEKKLLPGDAHLVIAGSRGWLYGEVVKFYRSSKFRGLIHFIGPVEEDDKAALYALSKVFVYPSFFEGFGFPPLEAMASGVPVVTSRTSSLPEVVGDSALLTDPHNIREMAEAMYVLSTDQKLRKLFSVKGRERALQFSWEKSAKKVMELLVDPVRERPR